MFIFTLYKLWIAAARHNFEMFRCLGTPFIALVTADDKSVFVFLHNAWIGGMDGLQQLA